MANVRVAVRVRPLSKRETKEGGRIIVEVDGKVAKIRNLKVDGRPSGFGDSREKVVAFGFDYCYWSVDPEDPQHASQDVVFQDLGTEVLSGAAKGYNICLFAYGQTGSGKTYTMLGTPASVGLTPRICEGLFVREENCAPLPSSCRIKVSFLEIYNERVRDLLKQSDQKKTYNLRVREHPEMGPYVQGLSQHVVTSYKQVIQLLEEGIANRITAATHVHEASSRSHAIFTIYYTQAILENHLPSEISSKINLVDLAGSERADPSYCKDRITEGANINKSLVTLGIVISTLAQNSQVFNSCQSFGSTVSDGSDSGIPSSPSRTSSGAGPSQRQSYIPYRDSVLTWLLKDSLGGNSRTIMVATVSPAHTSYSETMSTLRYASNAKNIINKPRVNEDANVKLIRELREEIGRLKAMLLSFELRNFHSLNEGKDENLKELALQNELKIDQLTKDWARKWNEWKALVEHYRVDINRRRAGLVIDSSLPHLMALEDDVLSTGVVLYHLKEGTTKIGRIDSDQEQDIVLQGQWIERDHCTITSACGVVILRPARGARCTVNGREVTASCRLTQGAVITLGKAQKFRFNHPAEAAVLRQRRQVGETVGSSGSLEWLDLDGDVTASRLGLCPLLGKERKALGEQSDKDHRPPRAGETPCGAQIQQQRLCFVGDLRQRILAGQIRTKQERELDGTCASQQVKDDQQWLLREGTWPAGLQQQLQQDRVEEKELAAAVPSDSWCQTDPETQPSPLVQSQKRVVHPQLLWRLVLRVAERNGRQRRVSFQLKRTIEKPRLLGTHRRPEQLRLLCWLQDDCPRRPPFPAPCPGALVLGPQRRSRLTRCSSLSLRRPCSRHSAQLRSIFLIWDPSTTSPPVPDPTEQLSEKTPSEEYLPQAAYYPPRKGHFIKHALRSSGEGQLCTARKALARKGASPSGTCLTESCESASVQEMERVALLEPRKLEEPQGKERDLPGPDDSDSEDSQISEDSLAEKGHQSPQDSPALSFLTRGHGHSRARAQASVRGFTTSSDRRLFTQTHRSFSLDSLVDAEEELGDDRQGEPFFRSADEMPTETFWRLQSSSLPAGDEEAVCRPGPISHRTGARLDAALPVSSSFYLELQPRCEQPELAVEASPTEQTNTLQDVQLSRGSPLASMDSWFSCDSKNSPSSPPGSLCPSPDVQDVQPCGWERPGYWPNMEELKSSDTETVLSCSSKRPLGGAELPCSVRSAYTVPVSDTTRVSLWGSYRLLQPGADGTFQARGVPDMAQKGVSEASDSSVSSLLAASATSFTYVGSACERDWAALPQKYLLELSHPVLEATGAPSLPPRGKGKPSLEEDSGSLTQDSGRGGDALLPTGPRVSSSPDFNNFPIHLSRIRRLRAEKEQDSLRVEVEGTSEFFTANEKEVSHSGTYSADVESSTSGTTNAHVSTAANKTAHPVMEAWGVKESSLEEASQSSENPGLMTSSDECFILTNACHHIVTIDTKEPHWPRGWAPLRKNSADPGGQLGQNSHHLPQEEKTDSQESSKEAGRRHSRFFFALPSGPELYLHSAPWNPLPSSLQPPPLETFYVTKSRDALRETALEIPACREAGAPFPTPREAWGFGHEHQVLQNVYVKNKLPALLQNQNSKIASSQQVMAERPADPNTKEACREKGKCLGNIKEESHNSVYFFVTQNRHFLPSTSIKVCEFENQVGILNKHSLPVLKQGEKATVQSYCSVSSDSSGSRKPPLVCESETSGEEEQGQDAVLRETPACDMKRRFPSGVRSDFIYKTINLGLDKDKIEEAARSLKSRSVHHRVSSPETAAQDESPTHKGERRNEIGLPGKALHPKDGSEEFRLPQAESMYERFQSVTCFQERNLGECKVPGKVREALNPKEEPPGKKRSKGDNNADEMARLTRSVMQLENGILEIESKQSTQLNASHTLGVSKEFMFQNQKDQEMADHVLRAGSQSFEDQPSSPKWKDDVIFKDGEAGQMEVNSSIDPQVHDIRFVKGHTHPAVLDTPARETGGYLGTFTVCRECTNSSAHPRETKASAGALPLQPMPERTSEEGELANAVYPRRPPRGLGSLEELETVKGVQESHFAKRIRSSKQEEPEVQGRVEETAMQRGSLQEKDKVVSLTQKLPGLCQHCVCTFFSQETDPLPSQPGSCMAPRRDLSNALPLNSARPPRTCLYVPGTLGISSVDCVLDPTLLKMPTSPLVTGAGRQDQSGEPGRHSPQHGDDRQGFSAAHPAWCGSVISMAVGSRSQSSAPASIPLGAEGRRSTSTSLQGHGGDLRSTLLGLGSRVGSPSEGEAAVPRGPDRASSLNRASSPLERRASCPLEEGDKRGRGERQKAEKEAEDLSPASGAFSAPVSLPRLPQPEPSAHPATCLAELEEIGQAKAQGKQLHNVVVGGTVLPHDETLLGPECSSGAPGRPQCPQMGQSVSARTRNEGEARGFHVASLSAKPGHLSSDERTSVLQATPPSADSCHPLPSTDTNTGPRHSSRTSSHVDPAPGTSHCSGKRRHCLGAGEQFVHHTSSSEIIEKEGEATRTPSSADALGSDSLPFSAAVEEDRRVVVEEIVAALPSQAPFDDAGGIPCRRGPFAAWEAAQGILPGWQESSPAHQEPGTLDNTWGGGPGNFLVAAQGGKPACFESHLVICDVQNSARLSGPNQDQGQCLEASTSLEEGKASPKWGAVLPRALGGIGLEAPSQQPVKREGRVGSRLAEACSASVRGPRPTPLPHQRPGGVREEALHGCPQETSDCGVFSGSTEGSRTLSPPGGQADSRSHPCRQPCNPQPVASGARASPSSTSLCYRDGDLGKGASEATPHTRHPPCMVPPRACGVERGEGHCREPDVLWAHGLEPKSINVELGPVDGSTPETSAAALLPPAQGCSSPSAPDVRTSPLSPWVADGSCRSVGDPEKKAGEKKVSAELEAPPFHAGRCSEPPGRFQDSSAGGRSAQGSQTKPEPPATAGGPHSLISEGCVASEPPVGPQHGCLGNAIRCLPEKPQLSAESKDPSGLDPQAELVAELQCVSGPQVDSPREEEEQQRDQASGGREDAARGRSPPCADEGGSGSCQIRGAGGEDEAVARLPAAFRDSATVPLGQRGACWPVAQGPGQPSSGGEQPAPCHRCSLPVIAIVSGPKHSRRQFSVVSPHRSLQELSLSVEPPSPTDEDIQEPSRLWTPHPRGCFSGKSAARTSLKAEGCNQEAASDLDGIAADPRPLPSTRPPSPVPSAVSCMPTPDLMAAPLFGTPEQAQPGKPERLGGQAGPEAWCSEAGGGALLFGSSAIDPCALPWRPEGPARVGWKQYAFGGAADVSRGPTPQGLTPSDMDRCSCEDDGLDDRGSPVYSHRRTLASARGLSSTRSLVESARRSREAWGVWGSSFALGSPHVLISSEGAAPPKGPDERGGFPGTPDEAGCLRREPPLAGGSAAGPVDEIMLLYPSEEGGPVSVSRMNTVEQGTQTLGCRSRWSHADLSSAQSDLASWASMHNLSLRLSQLLHSTSELLGSLSQPRVAEKEWNAKRETPGEVPQALKMDGCTQTTMDEGIQTDPASPPLHLQAPEANPQKVNVVLERLGSDLSITSQEKGHVPGTLKKRGAEGTARKIAGPRDLQEESALCRPQSAPVPSSHLSFQKVPPGQNLHPLSPQASLDAPLPPSLAGGSPGRSLGAPPSPGPCPHTVEPVEEPGVWKEQGPTSALLVDRASSPILTLSASTQGSGHPPGALSLSAPSAHSLEGCQKIVSRPSLPLGTPRAAVGNYSQTTDESGSSQRVEAPCGEGSSPLEGGDHRCSLGLSSRGHPEQSAKPQVRCVEQAPQGRQPRTTTCVQSRLSPPPPGSRSRRQADGFVPEDVASLECGPLSSRGLSRWQCRTENGGESSVSPEEPRPALNVSSSWGGLWRRRSCPSFELADTPGLWGCILGPTEACQPEGPLRPSSQTCMAPEPQHHGLRDLPVYNKSSDWCGGQDGSPGALGVMDLLGTRCDCSSGQQGQRLPQPHEDQSQAPEWSQREQIPLRVGAQTLSLSVELTEAKLHHGFGEADALLQVLQSGTGEALAAQEEEPYARPERTAENLRRERAERLQNFRRTQSLSPQKQLSFPFNRDLPTWAFDLPSRRREYLQQLRKDVVETTRSPRSVSRSPHPPSDIELMLQEYQRAREEAKVEIARARARLREQTEQEKLRIRQQIVCQLLREEEKLHTLAASSSWCTSSNGSLSSGVTSGYNSSPALPGQLQSPDSVGDTNLPDSRDSWIGEVWGRSAVRNSQLNLAGSAWKTSACSRRASLGSCCCSPSSLSSLGTSFSSSYKDLAKHIVDISMADVRFPVADSAGWGGRKKREGTGQMRASSVALYLYKRGEFSKCWPEGLIRESALYELCPLIWVGSLCPQVMAACSDNLNHLFSCQAAAGWNHQGEEQDVHLYYKVFSSTRHGFLGAGVVSQPLSHVWAAVSDPTLWPLYHKPIQTARLHQRVTNSISLVYLVCNTTLCALKQPRDFCCVCVEAKEGQLSIMAAQSVYDASMPRPSREMVRGEILPSAWILQPLTVEGKEITRVIYLAQVELGAPGFPPQLLSSFIKQQPLVIARLASFLGS
ncbi:stAR-related lipid transfer protein 9 isoform X3 [Sagmatias obliquidens]|uniref:stAR-related lipid transfer protein 9 isoform X3 n=1 Tax=Sagmatias obliquidens TaxID=3371155 RepID=UPI000F444B13|nr:stAR-related lipid transfer protein 9 isoform X3 [Lagenorhynchus obliquidens]